MSGVGPSLLLQLSDSAFPTGGFVHSGGLESAWQLGLVSRHGLQEWLHDAVEHAGTAMIPLLNAAHAGEELLELDVLADAWLNQPPANRASRAQGAAWISTAAAVFAVEQLVPERKPQAEHSRLTERRSLTERRLQPAGLVEPPKLQAEACAPFGQAEACAPFGQAEACAPLDACAPTAVPSHPLLALKQDLRAGRILGHQIPVLGRIAALLGLSGDEARHLALFLHLRGLISTAVRLGIVGPMEAQRIQWALAPVVDAVVAATASHGRNDLAGSAPLIDLAHGHHDRLYSRLFAT